MDPRKFVTMTLALGLATAPFLESADAPHTHTEHDLQLINAYSANCLAPSFTGKKFERSEEELVLIAHANAAMARWWSEFVSGANHVHRLSRAAALSGFRSRTSG